MLASTICGCSERPMFHPMQNRTRQLDRDTVGLFEYIGAYVNELLIDAKDPNKVIKALQI
jgi:hypothetical protein